MDINSYKCFIFGFLFLLFIPLVAYSALDVSINVSPTFEDGEVILFEYELSSDEPTRVTFAPLISCPDEQTPQLPLEMLSVALSQNQSFKNLYVFGYADLIPRSMECNATVLIMSPKMEAFSKKFKVNTKSMVEFSLYFSKDEDCSKVSSNLFKVGDIVFVCYRPLMEFYEITPEEISLSLKYPDGNVKQLMFPAKILLTKEGEYTVVGILNSTRYKPFRVEKPLIAVKEFIKPKQKVFVQDLVPVQNESNGESSQDIWIKKVLYRYWLVIVIVLVVLTLVWFIRNAR